MPHLTNNAKKCQTETFTVNNWLATRKLS